MTTITLPILVTAHLAADAASSKKRSRQLRSPFDESQTEYVKIPSTVKRRSVEALTEHQQEVAARQKAGEQGTLTPASQTPRMPLLSYCTWRLFVGAQLLH